MTPRERRYHQRQNLKRSFRRSHLRLMESFRARIEASKPVPKYPLGGKEDPALIGVGAPEVLPAYHFEMPAHVLPHLTMGPPVKVYAVDRDNNIFPVTISQMLQTFDYWAQDGNQKPLNGHKRETEL